MPDCATCGASKVNLIPKHRESDDCGKCRDGRAPTDTFGAYVVWPCSECGTEYRGPKFAKECCR